MNRRRKSDSEASFEGLVDLESVPPPGDGPDVHAARTAIAEVSEAFLEELKRGRLDRAVEMQRDQQRARDGFPSEAPTRPKDVPAAPNEARRPLAPVLTVPASVSPAASPVETDRFDLAAEVEELVRKELDGAVAAASEGTEPLALSFAKSAPQLVAAPQPPSYAPTDPSPMLAYVDVAPRARRGRIALIIVGAALVALVALLVLVALVVLAWGG